MSPKNPTKFDSDVVNILKTEEELDDKAKKIYDIIKTYLTPQVEDEFASLVELFPKNFRSKLRMLIHSVRGRIKLGEDGALLVKLNPSDSDFTQFSPAIDLFKYILLPSNLNTLKPSDANDFIHFLLNANVPRSLFGKNKATAADSWIPLY